MFGAPYFGGAYFGQGPLIATLVVISTFRAFTRPVSGFNRTTKRVF